MGKQKINILYLILDLDLGGLQRIVNLLIDRIDKEYYTPTICCLDRGGVFYEQLRSNEISKYILNRKPGLFDTQLFLKLYRLIKQNNIDIIHSHNGCTLYAVLAGRLAKVKGIIHTDHGRLIPDRKGAILEDRLSSYLLNYFVGVSYELTDYLESVVKIKQEKLITIINGVDTKLFQPQDAKNKLQLKKSLGYTEDDQIIGAVCRLDPIKNIEFLLNCIHHLSIENKNIKLLIVGDGPIKQKLIQYSNELSITKYVNFIGYRKDVESILPVIDIYVSTSLSEGTSMTILEAMSCGLPIVASDVGGNKKLVDRTNGYLYPSNDKDEFINAVHQIFNNEQYKEKLGKESRKKILDQFSIDQVVKQYEDLYQNLV